MAIKLRITKLTDYTYGVFSWESENDRKPTHTIYTMSEISTRLITNNWVPAHEAFEVLLTIQKLEISDSFHIHEKRFEYKGD